MNTLSTGSDAITANSEALPDATQDFTGYTKMGDGSGRMISPDGFFILSASRNNNLDADDFGAFLVGASTNHGGITDWLEINVNPGSDLGSFELSDVFVGEYDYGGIVLRFENVVISAYQDETLVAETAPYASQSDGEETRYPIDYSVFEGKSINRFRVTFTTKDGTPADAFNLVEFTIQEASTETPEPEPQPGVLLSTSPTLTFTENSGGIIEDNIATDGEGGSQAISDIDIQIYNISDESGTFVNSLDWWGNDILFSADPNYSGLTYDNNNEGTKGMLIKSADGSKFRLVQFRYYNWGENSAFTNTIKGYRDGGEVASMTFNGFDPGYNPMTVTLDASFSNVDEVRLFISDAGWAGDGTTNHSINDIQLTSPVSSSSPTVITSSPASITPTSAILGGNIENNGGADIEEYGIVWSTTEGFDPADGYEVEMENGGSSFSSTVNLLPFGTTIYYRAYATNSEGTAYGDEVSLQTSDELSLTLTGQEGWRLLTTPADVPLSTFLGPIWTQGVISGGDTGFGEPNVYTWNLTAPDDDHTVWWDAVTNLNNATLSAGQGALVYVYSDDNYDSTPDGFPKTLLVTGGEHPAPITSAPLNENNEGWTLLGNPFGSPVSWDGLSRTNVSDAIYVWEPNSDAGEGGQPANQNGGSWVTRSGGTGDFNGVIAPFQGFFVQNSGSSPVISFTQADKTGDTSTFYGKEQTQEPLVRLELRGQGMSNSTWLRFTHRGSLLEKVEGEAWQLTPMSGQYALLATQKQAGLMDIGHYPAGEELEIPLVTETTRPGTYTLTVTDYEAAGKTLYLHDVEYGQSLRLEQGMSYQFTLSQAAKTPADPLAYLNSDLRKKSATSPRFTLSTVPLDRGNYMPETVALNQIYPNPFNPTTIISYELPGASEVRLDVFDMTGRQVATLVEGQFNAGSHRVTFDGSNLSSGVYIYRLQAGSAILTKKLTLVK